MSLPTQIGTPTTGGSNASSHSRSYTCTAGSNRSMFVFVSQTSAGASDMSVTYNGVSLSEEFVLNEAIKIWVFRLDESNYPAIGSYTLSASGTSGTNTSVTVVEFENVNQNSLFEFSWNFNDGSGGAFSVLSTERTDAPIDGVVLSFAVSDSDAFTYSPNSGQTELIDSSPATNISLALGYENFSSGGAALTESWTRDSATTDDMAIATVVFGPPSNTTIVDDLFDGTALNSQWYKYDPQNHCNITVSDGNVNINVIGGSNHDLWVNNRDGVAILQDIEDKEVSIQTSLESSTGSGQSRGLIIFNPDKSEWIRFDQYSANMFFGYVPFGGSANIYYNTTSPVGVTDIKLSRTNEGGGNWSYFAEYSTDNGNNWTVVGGNPTISMAAGSVGLTSMNYSSFPTHTASYSYFYDTLDGIDTGNAGNAVSNLSPPPNINPGMFINF